MTQLFIKSRRVQLDVYDKCKYTAAPGEMTERHITYNYVTGFEVVEGEDAKRIEADTDASCIDDFHEYLVLFFEDGSTATFRNSYVDMFLIR